RGPTDRQAPAGLSGAGDLSALAVRAGRRRGPAVPHGQYAARDRRAGGRLLWRVLLRVHSDGGGLWLALPEGAAGEAALVGHLWRGAAVAAGPVCPGPGGGGQCADTPTP